MSVEVNKALLRRYYQEVLNIVKLWEEIKLLEDFNQIARKSGKVQNIREGKGSHVVVEFEDDTSVSVPVHGNRQLGKGIRHKLLKAFKAAGVIVLILIFLWLSSLLLVNFTFSDGATFQPRPGSPLDR